MKFLLLISTAAIFFLAAAAMVKSHPTEPSATAEYAEKIVLFKEGTTDGEIDSYLEKLESKGKNTRE